jgi:sugar/nucleoside kinase (ribokinase family)
MKIINFGSINIDRVYEVPHFVQPGETLASVSYQTHAGGKGLNQSVALHLVNYLIGLDSQIPPSNWRSR